MTTVSVERLRKYRVHVQYFLSMRSLVRLASLPLAKTSLTFDPYACLHKRSPAQLWLLATVLLCGLIWWSQA